MAISEVLELPNQPTPHATHGGTTWVQDLAGNGYGSPKFMYNVFWAHDMDASGGTIELNIDMDPMHSAILAFCTTTIFNALSDKFVRVAIKFAQENDKMNYDFTKATIGGTAAGFSPSATVVPPPIIMNRPDWSRSDDRPRVSIITQNVNTETLGVKAQFMMFERDAPTRVPVEQLYAWSRGNGQGS